MACPRSATPSKRIACPTQGTSMPDAKTVRRGPAHVQREVDELQQLACTTAPEAWAHVKSARRQLLHGRDHDHVEKGRHGDRHRATSPSIAAPCSVVESTDTVAASTSSANTTVGPSSSQRRRPAARHSSTCQPHEAETAHQLRVHREDLAPGRHGLVGARAHGSGICTVRRAPHHDASAGQ